MTTARLFSINSLLSKDSNYSFYDSVFFKGLLHVIIHSIIHGLDFIFLPSSGRLSRLKVSYKLGGNDGVILILSSSITLFTVPLGELLLQLFHPYWRTLLHRTEELVRLPYIPPCEKRGCNHLLASHKRKRLSYCRFRFLIIKLLPTSRLAMLLE